MQEHIPQARKLRIVEILYCHSAIPLNAKTAEITTNDEKSAHEIAWFIFNV
jgi:hypothetical protein